MKKVSICMATFNGERFLKKQIESILPQLDLDDELICSDDHSTDQSIRILESFKDPRIKIIKSPSLNNHIKNFENALSECQGELIFLSDQDDIWDGDKIQNLKLYLMSYDLVITDCSVIDENDHEIHESIFNLLSSNKGIFKNIRKNSYMGCCMAFHRRILRHILPFPKTINAHDQWIGLIAEKHYQVLFLPKALVKYRRHQDNFSTTGSRSKNSIYQKLYSRFELLKNLSLR